MLPKATHRTLLISFIFHFIIFHYIVDKAIKNMIIIISIIILRNKITHIIIVVSRQNIL